MNNKESAFYRLYRYRSREAHSPKENYFTEALAVVLENDCGLRERVIEHIIGKKLVNIKLSTQISYEYLTDQTSRIQPDLVFQGEDEEGAKVVLFVEVKIDSTEGFNQLKKYTDYLESSVNCDQKYLTYITANAELLDSSQETISRSVDFNHIQWKTIYKCIKEYLKNNQENHFLALELIKFMKEVNMVNDLTLEKMMIGNKYPDFFDSTVALLNNVWNHKYGIKAKLSDSWNSNSKATYNAWSQNGIMYFTPPTKERALHILYGLCFNAEGQNGFSVQLPSSELPVPFIAIYVKEGAKVAKTIAGDNREVLKVLAEQGWQPLEMPNSFLSKKVFEFKELGASDFSEILEKFFVNAINEIEKSGLLV